jgi:hypothetical protein
MKRTTPQTFIDQLRDFAGRLFSPKIEPSKEINKHTDHPRAPGTTSTGLPFPSNIVKAVWEKGENDPGFVTFKKDCCGALIQKNKYGTLAQHGWEIDHIKPVSQGGTDDLSNLQPLQWENNRHKGDKWPNWECLRP